LEPDLGTTIITTIVVITMLVVGGVRLRYLALLALAVLTAFVLGTKLHLLHSFQIQRLTSFLHQDECAKLTGQEQQDCQNNVYQLSQAKYAIGAGGFQGTGLFRGAMTSSGFVPLNYADTIFSAIGEQLGFVGSLVVVGLFGVMSLRMFRAIQVARDTFGRVVCAGCLAFVVFSVFENIGMNVGIMPITGIPLPFISFGGSALLATFAAVGLVANVEMRRARNR
jgi:rod shape determining protein RodA